MMGFLVIHTYKGVGLCPNYPHLVLEIFKKVYTWMNQVGDTDLLQQRYFCVNFNFPFLA